MNNIYMRLIAILVIAFFLWILDTQFFGYVMTDFLSIIKMGDIVSYNHTFVLIGGIPTMILMTISFVRILFSKSLKYKNFPKSIETWVTCAVIIPFAIGLIADCIVPFFFWHRRTPAAPRNIWMIIMSLTFHSAKPS
ncbi:TPA: hypothetical protein SLG96_002981 [Citrobacter koseri]|uniref:hypothetical protein n=1 Tax=Citrobacter koseri TaxID=545 RepID=UPI001904CB2B|nr:hypothetical protein [Citrobacter koseri]MBJ8941764.1 hypothetical protein [Citrobacter koseri]HAT8006462.1 hypothetical protein [Citrobacter koseri]HED2611697.1 hypothetical protein [Citrobacter koseri]HEI8859455.1 hypothetical protein [Citrobacter koseri]HEM7912972.1 hypothetical protein [Citrobacter koseri]